MKKYKLLKDLPFAKAGEELYLKFSEDSEFFLAYKGTDKAYTAELNPEFIDNFDEWFEEVEENKVPEEFYMPVVYADKEGIIANKISNDTVVYKPLYLNASSIGLTFKTEEEAKKHIEYLKAKTIIKQDTKGFKPNWNNLEQIRFYGRWDFQFKIPFRATSFTQKDATIYFKTVEDIEESFKKHPKEWKTYLTYEQ